MPRVDWGSIEKKLERIQYRKRVGLLKPFQVKRFIKFIEELIEFISEQGVESSVCVEKAFLLPKTTRFEISGDNKYYRGPYTIVKYTECVLRQFCLSRREGDEFYNEADPLIHDAYGYDPLDQSGVILYISSDTIESIQNILIFIEKEMHDVTIKVYDTDSSKRKLCYYLFMPMDTLVQHPSGTPFFR